MHTNYARDLEKLVRNVMNDVLRFSKQNGATLPHLKPSLPRLESSLHHFSIMRIIRLISSITPRGSDILDVGCGAGHIAAMLSSIGFNAIGFDVSIKNINRIWIPLKVTYSSQYMVADARKAPFGDETFNVIIAFAVLEHLGGISEEVMFLKECNRILKRKGFFVISGLPTKYALNEILGRGVGDAHNRRYTKKQIAEKLMASGLRLIYLRYDHFLPRYVPINFLNKLWNRLAPVIRKIDEKLTILPLSDSFIIVSIKDTPVPHGDTLEGPQKSVVNVRL